MQDLWQEKDYRRNKKRKMATLKDRKYFKKGGYICTRENNKDVRILDYCGEMNKLHETIFILENKLSERDNYENNKRLQTGAITPFC